MPRRFSFVLFVLLVLMFVAAGVAQAATPAELQSQIDDRNQKIKALEKEIAAYQKSLTTTTAQVNTLKGELERLKTETKKLNADIEVTKNKIVNTNLKIQSLALDINDKDENISQNQTSLRSSLRQLQQINQTGTLEILLAEPSFANFIAEEARLNRLEGQINENIATLRSLKGELTDRKTQTEREKKELLILNDALTDQKKLLDQNQRAKNQLLTETKNDEAAYRRLLTERQAQKEAFERELFDFESQLKITIDPSKLPGAGRGVLAWPLKVIRITQPFGRTVDAIRLYASGTHNGIDLAAAVGTPVYAAAGGLVKATGNTDEQAGCYSYGRWILLEHPNGLSTLLAHLSLTKVVVGQTVGRGALIGYSGNTGYTTGPHLHFTVYATEGLRIQRYASSKHCQNVVIPIADPKAYLDPMLYL